ncbi:putative T6SS immunity periplasmic lipoprotein [Enterobacteriaceae bacterium LUAb1]
MNRLKIVLPVALSSLLAGCWLGDSMPPTETTTVQRTQSGLCFRVVNAADYQIKFISVKNIEENNKVVFKKLLPSLNMTNEQFCIPDTYYLFPQNGHFCVRYRLESPAKMKAYRYVVTTFKLRKGKPYPFQPHESKVPDSAVEQVP